MKTKILVAYATKYGSTKEIAEKIGEVLQQAGLNAEVRDVKQVEALPVCDAVVLGSAAYIGSWRKSAAKFLKANEDVLKDKPVWLFSSGPTGEGDPVQLAQNWQFPKKLQPVADRIGPRDIALFHGNADAEKLTGFHKWMMNKVDAPLGDYRDWQRIGSWAKEIVDDLKGRRSKTG
ncbi:MAG: flavodoxin domain-containing protein [candidate division KSB1 bacterium]|nr:flavodoxin domain-containing protein [candidate division KSB1 bacterium]